jgi:hypothetical protein
MPQPIRGRLTNLHFESESLTTRKELSALLASAINEWSRTEGTIGLLLGNILKIRYSVATALLGSIVNFSARLDLVNAAAHASLPDTQITEIAKLMATVKRRAGERNQIVHGVWSVSTDYPNKLILCDAQVAFNIVNEQYETFLVPKDVIVSLRPHLKLWGDKDFLDLQQRFIEAQTSVIPYSNFLRADWKDAL